MELPHRFPDIFPVDGAPNGMYGRSKHHVAYYTDKVYICLTKDTPPMWHCDIRHNKDEGKLGKFPYEQFTTAEEIQDLLRLTEVMARMDQS